MSLSIPRVGNRSPASFRQRTPQHPPGGGSTGYAQDETARPDDLAAFTTPGDPGRTGIAALHRAIEVTEQGLILAATARHGLEAVQQRLARMAGGIRRALTERSSGSGPPPPEAWNRVLRALADDARAIDSLSRDTRCGEISLLDGSCGCRGAAFGPRLEFVSAESSVRSSPPEGYAVVLHREPAQAALLGDLPLTRELIAAGETLALAAEDRRIEIRTRAGESLADVAQALNQAAARAGLPLACLIAGGGRLMVRHRRFGRLWRFRARSSTPGILSSRDGSERVADNGVDAAGTINGEPAVGEGLLLRGEAGNRATAGLVVRCTFPPAAAGERAAGSGGASHPAPPRKDPQAGSADLGRVAIVQRSLTVRLEAAAAAALSLRIDAMTCAELGRSAAAAEGIRCVADALKAAPEQAEDALAVIERAQEAVALTAAAARRLECETLGGHLARLRIAVENLLASSGAAAPPTDVAAWAARLGDRLRLEAAAALAAQRHPRPTALLRLLENGGPG